MCKSKEKESRGEVGEPERQADGRGRVRATKLLRDKKRDRPRRKEKGRGTEEQWGRQEREGR